MTPDTSKARNLIEEARDTTRYLRERVLSGQIFSSRDLLLVVEQLDEALTLLPESLAPAAWQEFDPKREETWPKESAVYQVTMQGQERKYVDQRAWVRKNWLLGTENVLAYQPLPPPHVK